MDGAGTDDDEEAVVLAGDDLGGRGAALDDCLDSILGKRDFSGQEGGRDERILAEDYSRSGQSSVLGGSMADGMSQVNAREDIGRIEVHDNIMLICLMSVRKLRPFSSDLQRF
jgi:hypothetical protein